MLGERIVPQSEVIGAIISGYSPCCGPSHRSRALSTEKRRLMFLRGRRPPPFSHRLARPPLALSGWRNPTGITGRGGRRGRGGRAG